METEVGRYRVGPRRSERSGAGRFDEVIHAPVRLRPTPEGVTAYRDHVAALQAIVDAGR